MTRSWPLNAIAAGSLLTMVAGVAGMVVSFLFLASNDVRDVMAGAAGFVAGSLFIGASLVSASNLYHSPNASSALRDVAGASVCFVPPVVAILAWPVLYFAFFIFGLMAIPFVLFCCIAAAVPISVISARHASLLFHWKGAGESAYPRALPIVIFAVQFVLILGSWPAFVVFLSMLQSAGYKVGWS